MIHAIGDSHAHFFTGTNICGGFDWWKRKPVDVLEGIRSYSIGPATAYKFHDKHLDSVWRIMEDAKIKPDEYVLLAFGEVDCRWHISYQALKPYRNNIHYTLEKTVNAYFEGVLGLAEEQKVIVWGVPPPGDIDHDIDFPSYGTQEHRHRIARMWNEYLGGLCVVHGIPFVSIYWQLINKDLTTNQHYMLDQLHLNRNAVPFMLEALKPYV